MQIDDIIEIKSDLRYIKVTLDELKQDVKPLKSEADKVRGGLKVAAVVSSLILGGLSYIVHSRMQSYDDNIHNMQEQIALINQNQITVHIK